MDIASEFVKSLDMSDMLKYIGGTAGAVALGAVTATAAAWYVMTKPNVLEPRFDLNNQSKLVPVSSPTVPPAPPPPPQQPLPSACPCISETTESIWQEACNSLCWARRARIRAQWLLELNCDGTLTRWSTGEEELPSYAHIDTALDEQINDIRCQAASKIQAMVANTLLSQAEESNKKISDLLDSVRHRLIQQVTLDFWNALDKLEEFVEHAGRDLQQQLTVDSTVPIDCLLSTKYRTTVETVPVKAVSVKTVPVNIVPVNALSVETVPVKALSVETVPVKALSVETVPVKALSVETVPVKALSVKTVSVGMDGARASPFYVENGKLLDNIYDDVSTVLDMVKRGARVSNNGPCAGWRNGNGPYEWTSYNDILKKAENAGAGLVEKGLKQSNSTHVGMYLQNRVEYIVSELACYMNSMAIVPLYDTLGVDACVYIINQSEIELVICDKVERIDKLLDNKKNTPNLRIIVHIEPITEAQVKRAEENNVDLIKYTDLEILGEKHPHPQQHAKDNDLSVICYTSGTTGKPKGAMVTHHNIVACTSAIDTHLSFLRIGPEDVMISYLPLAHTYERICELYVYLNGGQMGFYRGDVRKLMDDIATLRPTVFPSVPRLLNRVYDKVLANVSTSSVKKMMFDYAVASKLGEVKKGIIRNDSIWDKLVFKKVQESLGGRVRFIVCGSAPLAPRVLDFLRAATGAVVLEGYGQTECTAVCSIQLDGESGTGHVGVPLPCCFIKVVDVPDMNYYAKNQEGEICIKGNNVISGYYKMPDKTAEALDETGWLHTGDIGKWLPNGALKIIDRKKNMFKLAQGEYISPEKVEDVYMRSPVVAQVFVHGDSLKACVVGIVVLDPDTMHKWAKEKLQINGMSMKQLCKNKEVNMVVLKELNDIGKAAGLFSFEQVKDIFLFDEMFSVENGLLTPTFKVKRHECVKYFKAQIDDMYSKLT